MTIPNKKRKDRGGKSLHGHLRKSLLSSEIWYALDKNPLEIWYATCCYDLLRQGGPTDMAKVSYLVMIIDSFSARNMCS